MHLTTNKFNKQKDKTTMIMSDVYREAEARKVKEEFDALPTRRFTVRMLASGNEETRRVVEIPNKPDLQVSEALNLVYKYGQNEIQPQKCYSVSVGDVIICGGLWLVASFGFRKLSLAEWYRYRTMDRDARWFLARDDSFGVPQT
jgi:hypothetical protein